MTEETTKTLEWYCKRNCELNQLIIQTSMVKQNRVSCWWYEVFKYRRPDNSQAIKIFFFAIFFLLMVGILVLMNRLNFMFSSVEQENIRSLVFLHILEELL